MTENPILHELELHDAVRKSHPHSMLLFRMGESYRAFRDDARILANALGLAVTKEGRHPLEAVPTCTMPVTDEDAQFGKLLRRGISIAICQQEQVKAYTTFQGCTLSADWRVVRKLAPGVEKPYDPAPIAERSDVAVRTGNARHDEDEIWRKAQHTLSLLDTDIGTCADLVEIASEVSGGTMPSGSHGRDISRTGSLLHVATEVLRKARDDIHRLELRLDAMHDDPGA